MGTTGLLLSKPLHNCERDTLCQDAVQAGPGCGCRGCFLGQRTSRLCDLHN